MMNAGIWRIARFAVPIITIAFAGLCSQSRAAPHDSKPAARKKAAPPRSYAPVVEQLGSFDADARRKSSALLESAGEAGITALLSGLSHPKLAVRVGAFDTLSRLLSDRYRIPPASIPRYDAWASKPERAKMAATLRNWWARRSSARAGHAL